MTRLPTCTPSQVERVLKHVGFFLDHTRGSHRYYRHPDRPGLIVIPFHPGTLKRGTLHNIIKLSGLTRDHFSKLL